MGLLPLTYRRPSHVSRPSSNSSNTLFSEDGKPDVSLKSGKAGPSASIPEALTFDRIIQGGTCPPCTLRDFMNYLVYVEYSAENLQFFLWLRDYTARFARVPESEAALSPEWTQAEEEEVLVRIQKDAAERIRRAQPPTADMFLGTDFDEKPVLKDSFAAAAANDDGYSQFDSPPLTPEESRQDSMFTGSHTGTNLSSYRTIANDAYLAAGADRPFTIQPFRAEIDRVVATYIADRSPRQLNLSSKERSALLHALSHTTHPSAFRSVGPSIEAVLRYQAHPNFIRWAICNGNPIRTAFARWLGASTILLSTIAAIIITLSCAPRGYRAIPGVGWFLGVATLIAAWKGMCVVLHGMHHQHVRPWELFETGTSDFDSEVGEKKRAAKSFESFGSSNSYEDEPWVVKYDRRFVLRKVFDREVWIQEPALRSIQDTIFFQAVLGGLLVAGVLVGVFVGVPGGGFF